VIFAELTEKSMINFTQPDKFVFIALQYAENEADALAKFKARLKEKGIEYSETDN
jgi:hypothetical protein